MTLLTASQHYRSRIRPHPPQCLRPSPPIKPRRLLSRQPHLQTLLRLRLRQHQHHHHQPPSSHLRPPRRTLPPLHHQQQQQPNPHQRKPNHLPRRHRRILLRNRAHVHRPHSNTDSRQLHRAQMDSSARRRRFPVYHRPLPHVAAARRTS